MLHIFPSRLACLAGMLLLALSLVAGAAPLSAQAPEPAAQQQAPARHVGGEALCHPPFLLNRLHRFLRASDVGVNAKHLGALAREENRRRFAVADARSARARARNDRHLVLQSSRHKSS